MAVWGKYALIVRSYHLIFREEKLDAPPYNLKRRLIAAWEAAGLKGRGGIYDRGFDSVARFHNFEDFCEQGGKAVTSKPVRCVYGNDVFGSKAFLCWDRDQFANICSFGKGVTGLGREDSRVGISEFLEEFSRLPGASELRVLDYGPGDLRNGELELLASLKSLTNLLVLDCNGVEEMDDTGVSALAGAAHLKSLVALRLGRSCDLESGYIGPDEIGALIESPCFTNLRQLAVSGHWSFNDEALHRLLTWARVGQLEVLEFAGTQVRSGGLWELSRCPGLMNLRRLVISMEQPDVEALTRLLASPHLIGLRELRVDFFNWTLPEELRAQLAARFGDFSIEGIQEPPPVCTEDRIRNRYRSMDYTGRRGYWGRPNNREYFTGRILHPEYAIL